MKKTATLGNTSDAEEENGISASFRVGIDVRGTFTDLYLLDEEDGSIVGHKLPSTPDNPYEAPIKGIQVYG